ncbi:MAG TPA: 3-oxoacyl-[acyl-carrier-protein] synthase III C-terminal domain-containing protein [Acidimicrobiales bacterium]|nr:3-oxoacyl-[acyl-carrier-protein] synthase III C-terminal domain-containing protein [Acidimicrobiales bacterium]
MYPASPTWLLTERSPGDASAPYVADITSAGRSLPVRHLSSEDLIASTRHHTGIDLERLTGIRERRVVSPDDDSLTLAVAAAADCLERGGVEAPELDALVSCSITKYRDGTTQWLEPAMSSAVAHRIGATRAVTFDIANACAGMLTGVFVLNNWIRRGAIRRGLVVSGESISGLGRNAAHHVRNIMSKELASLTLGDAGAAVVVERSRDGSPGISVAGFTTVAEHSRLCLAYPAVHEPGARMFTRSQALQRAAIKDTPVLLQEALDVAGIDISQVDHVIPHQTSARAIRKGMAHVSEVLGAGPRNDAVVTVDHYGNTASTTHTVALIDELSGGRIAPGDQVAFVAIASGLVIGVVLFRASEGLVRSHGDTD